MVLEASMMEVAINSPYLFLFFLGAFVFNTNIVA